MTTERAVHDTSNFVRELRLWLRPAETRDDLVEVPASVLLEAAERLEGMRDRIRLMRSESDD